MNQERVASSSCPARPTHETPSVHLGNARAFCVRSVCFRRGVMTTIFYDPSRQADLTTCVSKSNDDVAAVAASSSSASSCMIDHPAG